MPNDLSPYNFSAFTDEKAKAVGKVADFGKTIVESGSELAGYMGKVLGTIPEDTVGLIIGDPLHAVRTVIAAKLDELVTNILKRRHVETGPVSPSVAIPLLRAAYDESRPEIQELWAKLIAAAMDTKRAARVRLSFIETVKRFDPLDAVVLQELYGISGKLEPNSRDFLASKLQVSSAEIAITGRNLITLGCVQSIYSNTSEPSDFYITTYGRELVRVCVD